MTEKPEKEEQKLTDDEQDAKRKELGMKQKMKLDNWKKREKLAKITRDARRRHRHTLEKRLKKKERLERHELEKKKAELLESGKKLDSQMKKDQGLMSNIKDKLAKKIADLKKKFGAA